MSNDKNDKKKDQQEKRDAFADALRAEALKGLYEIRRKIEQQQSMDNFLTQIAALDRIAGGTPQNEVFGDIPEIWYSGYRPHDPFLIVHDCEDAAITFSRENFSEERAFRLSVKDVLSYASVHGKRGVVVRDINGKVVERFLVDDRE